MTIHICINTAKTMQTPIVMGLLKTIILIQLLQKSPLPTLSAG